MAVSPLGSLTPEFLETLSPSRQEAWDRFAALPWPTAIDEEWRRTDPGLFSPPGADFSAASSGIQVGAEGVSPELVRLGVIVTNLTTALRQFPKLAEQLLFSVGEPEGLKKHAALHKAFWQEGLFCYVPAGVQVEVPVKSSITAVGGRLIFPHSVIVVGEGSTLTLIDERRSDPCAVPNILSNEMVEIAVKAGATLRYIHLQQWGSGVTEIFTQRAELEPDAQFLNLTVGLGGRLTKANVETVLTGSGCRSDLLGVFFGSEKQHFDFHTLQDHRARSTVSDLLYKSALKDQAQAIYTGLIRIRKEAQKSDAYQANRNLLLSQGAKADSIPMLEIEADDVRCTHGVAVGPVDEEQAFYLMSRGLDPLEAQHLIVEGFFEQVFGRIGVADVRDRLIGEVAKRLS